MSTQFAFWRGGDDLEPQDVYDTALNDEPVDGVQPVDAAAVQDACQRAFADWTQDGNLWTHRPDADGNGPGFDLEIGEQVVTFTCYGLGPDQFNEIIDVMQRLGYPLYDPQIDERFPL